VVAVMRRAVLARDESHDEGTLGVLTAPGLGAVHVMEPPWRANRANRSCIPPGLYRVVPHVSPRYGRVLAVAEVPERTHILVHAGNVGGDVALGLHTHTKGCLLPGLHRGRLKVRGRMQRAVLNSRTAVRHILAWADDAPFELEIDHA